MYNPRDIEGYELAHSEESLYTDHAFGIKVFVKMTDRALDKEDHRSASRVADLLKREIETNSAKLDPKGPAQREAYRTEIEDIYRKAEVPAIYMEVIPNGYCSQPCCLNRPWFKVTSWIGHVVIGWRKRVISIDWQQSTVKKTGEELFPNEDVTRTKTGIHAWGHEAAIKYLKVLHGVK